MREKVLRERAEEKTYMGSERDQSRDISTEQRSNVIKTDETVKPSKKGDNEK